MLSPTHILAQMDLRRNWLGPDQMAREDAA